MAAAKYTFQPGGPSFCKRYGNKIYDYFAIFISLLDLTTDILVLIEFYTLERNAFFIISLIILITAQISYVVAFTSRYGKDEYRSSNILRSILLFICILPCAPFVSIAMYIAETSNVFGNAYNEQSGINITKSPLRKWMDKKLRSHLGFILEATIEAFPQRSVSPNPLYIQSHGHITSYKLYTVSYKCVPSYTTKNTQIISLWPQY